MGGEYRLTIGRNLEQLVYLYMCKYLNNIVAIAGYTQLYGFLRLCQLWGTSEVFKYYVAQTWQFPYSDHLCSCEL
jgi:hypothetical protein